MPDFAGNIHSHSSSNVFSVWYRATPLQPPLPGTDPKPHAAAGGHERRRPQPRRAVGQLARCGVPPSLQLQTTTTKGNSRENPPRNASPDTAFLLLHSPPAQTRGFHNPRSEVMTPQSRSPDQVFYRFEPRGEAAFGGGDAGEAFPTGHSAQSLQRAVGSRLFPIRHAPSAAPSARDAGTGDRDEGAWMSSRYAWGGRRLRSSSNTF